MDEYLVRQYPQHEEKSLRAWIARRKVKVDSRIVDKAGTMITEGQQGDQQICLQHLYRDVHEIVEVHCLATMHMSLALGTLGYVISQLSA